MSSERRLSDYKGLLDADEARFTASVIHPVVVAGLELEDVDKASHVTDSSMIGLTNVAKRAAGIPAPMNLPVDAQVFEVRKQNHQGNPFPGGITVGRMPSNDIVLSSTSISRFHAYFQWDTAQKQWRLVDASSRNGTWIGPLRVDKGGSGVLFDGSSLRFGRVPFDFYLPASFMRLLRESPIR